MNSVLFGQGSADVCRLIELQSKAECRMTIDRTASKNMSYKKESAQKINKHTKKILNYKPYRR